MDHLFIGGSTIDFQKAEMEDGATTVVCISLMGGTDLIVPKELSVVLSGLSLFGGQKVKASGSDSSSLSDGKSLHVNAWAILAV